MLTEDDKKSLSFALKYLRNLSEHLDDPITPLDDRDELLTRIQTLKSYLPIIIKANDESNKDPDTQKIGNAIVDQISSLDYKLEHSYTSLNADQKSAIKSVNIAYQNELKNVEDAKIKAEEEKTKLGYHQEFFTTRIGKEVLKKKEPEDLEELKKFERK